MFGVMKKVKIYTDGACSYNPGPGGWGAILMFKNKKKEISGGAEHTTNNKMEITAVLEALYQLKEKCKVELYSDSAYVINAFQQDWISKWQARNWKNAKGEPVVNREMWEKLIELNQYHKITWIKVKGHSDNEFNNRCDELARMEVDKILENSSK